jgi:hypothetical protein
LHCGVIGATSNGLKSTFATNAVLSPHEAILTLQTCDLESKYVRRFCESEKSFWEGRLAEAYHILEGTLVSFLKT